MLDIQKIAHFYALCKAGQERAAGPMEFPPDEIGPELNIHPCLKAAVPRTILTTIYISEQCPNVHRQSFILQLSTTRRINRRIK